MSVTDNKKRKVILVDDNPTDLQICKMVFKRILPDIEFEIFDNGFTAMQWMAENEDQILVQPNYVLLLDLNMPVMDGWGFLNFFENLNSSTKQKMNIYILTSSIAHQDKERAKKYSSVKQFYTKPLTIKMIKDILPELNKVG